MSEIYAVGDRVRHIPTGAVGVVVKVYEDRVLVEDGQGDYRYWPLADAVKREEKR